MRLSYITKSRHYWTHSVLQRETGSPVLKCNDFCIFKELGIGENDDQNSKRDRFGRVLRLERVQMFIPVCPE